MAKLFYQGHGSYRITANDGRVIYVDPYAGTGYEVPADFILVTHGHHDHDNISLPAKKEVCKIITYAEALVHGEYRSFSFDGITVEAVPAYNSHHSKEECVGYLLSVDGLTVYASGDTSETAWMNTASERGIDYALYPIDGVYNMSPAEASKAAAKVKAKHDIPVHMKPGELFDRAAAERFISQNRLIVEPGQEISL